MNQGKQKEIKNGSKSGAVALGRESLSKALGIRAVVVDHIDLVNPS